MHFLIEAFSWLRIAIAPTLFGLIAGAVVWAVLHDALGIILGVLLTFIGLLAGVLWAERVRRTVGTMQYLSRGLGSPDLDSDYKSKQKS